MKKLLVILCAIVLCSCELKSEEQMYITIHEPGSHSWQVAADLPIDSCKIDGHGIMHFWGKKITGQAKSQDCFVYRSY